MFEIKICIIFIKNKQESEAMKIITIIGARPQFIKAATVSRIISKRDDVSEVIVHTGQHFDQNMSDVFFDEMEIPKPDYHFAINGMGHGAMTGQMLEKIEEVLFKEKPDWVLVYGDTNSTLAGALAASKLHIKVAHVEAGLRSFNMRMPEEQNRILTDRISSVLFCPTEQAVKNLKKEGYENLSIEVENVGDVMFDAAMFYSEKSEAKASFKKIEGDFVLVTCHRAENTDDPSRLRAIVNSLNEINKAVKVILPLHPRTKKMMEKEGLSFAFETTDPVGYFDMVELLKNCKFVITDSGGLQKEAYFFNKPCITMRDETEWIELVDHGVNTLVGAKQEKILAAFSEISNKTIDFPKGLYGDAKAAEKIVDYLINNN
jgi:UDP-GlcNAc3NAcA epimerase